MRERLDRYFQRGCYADTTVQADPGSGGANFAVDDAGAGGVYPYAKMAFGGSGTQTPVSASNPVPVDGAAGTFPVTGTIAVTQSTSPWVTSGTITATGTVAATQSGTWNIGTVSVVSGTVTVAGTVTATGTIAATQSGTWNVANGGTFAVQPTSSASGGAESYSTLQTSAAVIAASVKASAGKIYDVQIFNAGTAAVYARLYNVGTSPATSDTPIWRGVVPGVASGAGAGAGFAVTFNSIGRDCSAGIGIRVTGAIADNDATALAANQVMANVGYE